MPSVPCSANIAQFELANGIRIYAYENFASPAAIVSGYLIAGALDEHLIADPDLFYLTGFTEPEAAAVFDADRRIFTLFVRPKDRAKETWEGRRSGPEGAVRDHGADRALLRPSARHALGPAKPGPALGT